MITAIRGELDLIHDNSRSMGFEPPVSQLSRGALDDPLLIPAPHFGDELRELAGARLSAAQLAQVRETATFNVSCSLSSV